MAALERFKSKKLLILFVLRGYLEVVLMASKREIQMKKSAPFESLVQKFISGELWGPYTERSIGRGVF
jgi:hypothetical protein